MKSRFRHFGSAKVLKNLYRKHRLESGTCLDLLGTLLPAALGGSGGQWGRGRLGLEALHTGAHFIWDKVA